MNLSEPLESLVGPVPAAVLRVLSRTDAGLSGRQVHAVAHAGSASGVNRTLGALARVGLVSVESRPPSLIYRPNRTHVLWAAVESALGARDRALDGIRLFLAEDAPDEVPAEWRVTAILYGSVARRTSTEDSDVDVLLVFPDGYDDDSRARLILGLAERIEELTGSAAQVNPMDRGEFARREMDGDDFLANVLRDGIYLCGPRPEEWAC
ncbi:nucleotidyltransferase domain-containing protein [Microbacterium sp. SL62]|uniref:nucleotidyltransferase family protein n=1 Tax=Microbacterium sp. SL62 TaxID=2995139 RepID=UPI002276C9EE|nr:nucleotidyltransferase domain-containing protein [Microbacterium sp. SL62]MCY1715735.1 nucleotidyltransferase domain-containing protein [Microbacterium sp. SL62]